VISRLLLVACRPPWRANSSWCPRRSRWRSLRQSRPGLCDAALRVACRCCSPY